MKNFKKIIIIGAISISILIYAIYKTLLSPQYQEIDFDEEKIENIQDVGDTENEEPTDEKEYIVLHITGEVINPGIIKIEEGRKGYKCNRSGRWSDTKCKFK